MSDGEGITWSWHEHWLFRWHPYQLRLCFHLFWPLKSNRCGIVHLRLWSCCLTANHLIWFGKEPDPERRSSFTSVPKFHCDASLGSCYFPECVNSVALLCPSNQLSFCCRLRFCRAPVRKCPPPPSCWGWSSRGHIRLWRGRRGSALHPSHSVLTESCRNYMLLQVCWKKLLIFLHSPSAAPCSTACCSRSVVSATIL